jgi:hypothetical protein
MSLSVHCCEGMNISKLFCNWCASKKKKKTINNEQILYTDSIKQIVILSTPQIECPDLLVYEDIDTTDIIIFSLDEENQIRFASLQGSHLLKALTSSTTLLPESKQKITSNRDLVGHPLEEVLPDYITRFLMPIYRQTLQGNYLQLTTMWMRTTQLVRTFPILNHKKEVIAGIAITSPFNPDFNGDINKFSLNKTEEKSEKKKHGPIPQTMPNPPKTPRLSEQKISTPRKITQPSPKHRHRISIDQSDQPPIPLFQQNQPTTNNDTDTNNNNSQITEHTESEHSTNNQQ